MTNKIYYSELLRLNYNLLNKDIDLFIDSVADSMCLIEKVIEEASKEKE